MRSIKQYTFLLLSLLFLLIPKSHSVILNADNPEEAKKVSNVLNIQKEILTSIMEKKEISNDILVRFRDAINSVYQRDLDQICDGVDFSDISNFVSSLITKATSLEDYESASKIVCFFNDFKLGCDYYSLLEGTIDFTNLIELEKKLEKVSKITTRENDQIYTFLFYSVLKYKNNDQYKQLVALYKKIGILKKFPENTINRLAESLGLENHIISLEYLINAYYEEKNSQKKQQS